MNKVYLFIAVFTVSFFPYFTKPMHNNAVKEYENPLVRGMAAAYPGVRKPKSGSQEQDHACALMPPLITLAALGEALFNKDFARELSSFLTEEGSVLKYQIACLLLKGIMRGDISSEEIPHTWQKIQRIFLCAMPPVDKVLCCSPVELLTQDLVSYGKQFAELDDKELPLVIRRELFKSFCSKVEPTLYNRYFSKAALMQTKFIKGLGSDLENEIPEELKMYGIPGKFYAEKHREVSFLAVGSGLAVIASLVFLNLQLVKQEEAALATLYELEYDKVFRPITQFAETLANKQFSEYEEKLLTQELNKILMIQDHHVKSLEIWMLRMHMILSAEIIGPGALGTWSLRSFGLYFFGEDPFIPALYRGEPQSEKQESSDRIKRSICACLGFPAGFFGAYAFLKWASEQLRSSLEKTN